MTLSTILLVVLVLILIGAVPAWPATALVTSILLNGPIAYAQTMAGPAITADDLDLRADREVIDNIEIPSLRRYGYFVSADNKVVIVEPASRQVVRIITQQ